MRTTLLTLTLTCITHSHAQTHKCIHISIKRTLILQYPLIRNCKLTHTHLLAHKCLGNIQTHLLTPTSNPVLIHTHTHTHTHSHTHTHTLTHTHTCLNSYSICCLRKCTYAYACICISTLMQARVIIVY